MRASMPHRPSSMAVAALVGGVVVLLYLPVFWGLVHVWLTDTYAAHGLLVAPFSAWTAFVERERLCRAARQPRWQGWLVVIAGLAVLAVGRSMESPALQAVSAPVVVSGWVLGALGTGSLRILAFPICFLVFLAPLPRPFVDALSLDLQRFAAWYGAEIASIFGVPVYREDVFIQLPLVSLQIAEICNGLRFLSALVVFTVALGHVAQLDIARQLVLVAVSVLLAVVANGTRILAIVLAVHLFGPEAASGLIHHAIGKVVWILTLVPLGLAAWGLRRPVAALPASTSLPTRGTRV